MAASFHQGFSDHPAEFDVEVGHYLGLRWFHLKSVPDPQSRLPEPATTAIRNQRLAIWRQLKDLAEGVASTNRLFSRAEQASWDTGNAELDALDARLAATRHRHVPVLSGVRDIWQGGENMAKCLVYDGAFSPSQMHAVPAERCGCGFWAYWALGEKQVSTPAVAGIIKGYGEAIEGELGFRCSHAKIVALFPLVYSTELALALEDAYGADVFHSFQAMLEMNKAPAGQPPLTDAYFSRRRVEAGNSSFSYTYAPPKLTRINDAFRQNLVPCVKCTRLTCGPGQAKCVVCEIADLTHPDTVRKIVKP